jgi:hypothetical protein
MNLPGRFQIKAITGGNLNAHVGSFDHQGEAIDAAETVRGYDRVFVIDTHERGAVVWDSDYWPIVPGRTGAK